ncbi:MAG: DegT/DnrJ/EryC1/StrS aminotransferase family protein [Desulfarculus sp.]|nr:DegT/DnrJ/EryC1/StrS aminotransferase family protein [Desulfarculus sp.]
MDKVDFFRHGLGPEEKAACLEVLEGLFITTGGACARFEEEFAAYLGAGQAVTVATGTAALELALMALDIGPGDEVITTPMTFIATANVCLELGARPVLVDVEPATGNLDAGLVEAAITPRGKAILPVHLYGAMCDMRALRAIADRHGLKIVSDCAHAIESRRDGLGSADLAEAACYSFYATKNITCAEGGAVAVHDPALAERIKCLRMHGMSKGAADRYVGGFQHWDMLELGRKANLPDVLAAMLSPQLRRIERMWTRREEVCRRYEEAFAPLPGVDFPRVPAGSKSARHLFTIWVKERDRFLGEMQARGIGVSVNYRAIHLLSYYRQRFGYKPGDFPVAERIGDSTLTLPLFPTISDDEVARVIEAVSDVAALLN